MIVRRAMSEQAAELLSVTLSLFQIATPQSAIYLDLRRLSHIAASFQKSESV
jgi:hypothetical protein